MKGGVRNIVVNENYFYKSGQGEKQIGPSKLAYKTRIHTAKFLAFGNYHSDDEEIPKKGEKEKRNGKHDNKQIERSHL